MLLDSCGYRANTPRFNGSNLESCDHADEVCVRRVVPLEDRNHRTYAVAISSLTQVSFLCGLLADQSTHVNGVLVMEYLISGVLVMEYPLS